MLCLKEVPTFLLSVTLSNLNRFSHVLHSWKAYEICYKNPYKIYLQRVWGKTSHFKHGKYQNLWTNNKVRGGCIMLSFSFILAEYLQKFEFLISQGIVATRLRWGGRCHMGFVANCLASQWWCMVATWIGRTRREGGSIVCVWYSLVTVVCIVSVVSRWRLKT